MSPARESSLSTFRLNNKLAHKSANLLSASFLLSLCHGKVLYPLLDQCYLYNFEPDVQTSIDLAFEFCRARRSGQPKPDSYPPYFDAQSSFTRSDSWREALPCTRCDRSRSSAKTPNLGIFAVRHTSLAIYSIGVGFAFLIFLQLSRNVWLAAVLAAFVLLSPQMLNIDFFTS